MCVMDFGGSWEKYLPLVEFAYNNSYHSTIMEIMELRLATGFGGLKPTHSLAPVTTYKSGM